MSLPLQPMQPRTVSCHQAGAFGGSVMQSLVLPRVYCGYGVGITSLCNSLTAVNLRGWDNRVRKDGI